MKDKFKYVDFATGKDVNPDSIPENTYVVIEQMGNCRICKRHEDLRCGVCWDCQPQVDGKYFGNGVHELWDSKNPSNRWKFNQDFSHPGKE